MIFFPHCKINLGLRILRKRPDGYHDLDTLFYPLPIKDALEITPSPELRLSVSGIPIPGGTEDNLCLKAWHLVKKDFPDLSTVHIHLLKHIPIGAGLGGGSADGAYMLRLLNSRYRLQLEEEQLMDYAARLGSDCPFFIQDKPCLGGGRGEQLRPVDLDLSGYSFVIIHPGIHISTPWAFSQCTPGEGGKSVEEVISQPLHTWKEELVNDFERPVLEKYPQLRQIKEQFYLKGAVYTSMTGSGSGFFGIFPKNHIPDCSFGPNYQVLQVP